MTMGSQLPVCFVWMVSPQLESPQTGNGFLDIALYFEPCRISEHLRLQRGFITIPEHPHNTLY